MRSDAAPRSPAWRRWLARVSIAPAAAIVVATTAPWWPGQICSHWTLHCGIALLPAVLVFGRRPLAGATLIVLIALACLPWIGAGLERRAPTPATDARALTVASGNIAAWNHWRSAAAAAAARSDADLLCLIEVRPDNEAALRGDPRWPDQVWAQRPSGIGLLSALPILERHVHGDQVNPLIEAIVDCGGRRLRVVAVHTTSPTSPWRQRERARELRMIANLVQQDDLPALVLGDFNLSVADPEWHGFALQSGLLRPAGHEPATWPSLLGPFAIGIDHLLGRGLAIGEERAIWLPGSDHRGLVARVAIP